MSDLEPIYHPGTPYTNEEKAHNRQVWVAALRSGEYQQGTGYLNSGDFCCLGVLCEVLGVAKRLNDTEEITMYEGCAATAPKQAVEATGLLTGVGQRNNGVPSLAELNDEHKLTFEQIANVIENEVEEYFHV